MNNKGYRNNHYVPQWYQKRFLPSKGEQKLFYLDLAPECVLCGDGKYRKRKALRRLGTTNCFAQNDLYTTFFGDLYSTEIEQKFFGKIDTDGCDSVEYFNNFTHPNYKEKYFKSFLRYISVQKLRTPKGLYFIKNIGQPQTNNELLMKMQELQDVFCATWTECVWQIADASNSAVKFILSDHPVTVYNRKCFPGSKLCKGLVDPDIRLIGTHTLFPLSENKIIILTNLSWVRNPFGNPKVIRPNPALYRPTIFNFTDVQVDRMLEDEDVLEINYVIKQRSNRYIAASNEEWLYPEKHISTGWYNLGEGDLFMPDPRSIDFTCEVIAGYESGYVERMDEYGQNPLQKGFCDPLRQNNESTTFMGAQAYYAKKYGPKRRGLAFRFCKLDEEIISKEIHKMYLSYLKYVPKSYRK